MLKAQWIAGVFMSSEWCAHQFAMLCRLKPHRTLNTVLSIIYFHSCGTTIAADGNFIFTWSYTRTWQNSKIRQDWNLLNSWPTLLFFQGDLTLVWALFGPFFCLDTQTHRHQFCIVYNNSWHERRDNSYKIGEAVMKIGGLEVAISQSMCAWPQWW